MKYKIIFLPILLLSLFSCSENVIYDLVIKNATVLNVETGEKREWQNILIKDGLIVKITDKTNFKFKQEIDANGKLVTPSFIDTHIHPTDDLAIIMKHLFIYPKIPLTSTDKI